MFRRLCPRLFCLCAALSFLPPIFAERIVFSADSMSGTVGDKSDETQLKGEAYVLTETMEISADLIKMSGTDFRYIEADGSVVGKNLESHLEFSCGSLRYDRETKIAQLQDEVTLADIENDVAAKAQIIEYNQTQDIAVMQIDIELKQKDNVCTGAYAVYRKGEQMLELSGNAQIKQGSDTFRAQEITLDLDSQEITLDGRVKGSIVDERTGASGEDGSEDAAADGGDSAVLPDGSDDDAEARPADGSPEDGAGGGEESGAAEQTGGASDSAEDTPAAAGKKKAKKKKKAAAEAAAAESGGVAEENAE